ncbi:MAG: lytic transglycosylase domain-containing protein [Sulfuricurvum sp.]|nr:lytic transglycosylase domain-containing protein [Sulfuricurvum sp.]
MKKIVLFLLFVSVLSAKVSDYDPYFDEAGKHYNIPPLLLKNIAKIESSGNPNAIRINDNGTKDYGLMQINSIHFRRLAQWGINEHNIMDPKINIFVGSWLLSEHIKTHGFNLQAIGNYHSKTPIYKEKWLRRLSDALKHSS